jgi:riboflavin kinase / FMN adenylyltransferase
METLHSLEDIARLHPELPEIGLTIGNFDGVHLGHQKLLKKIKKECLQKKISFVVVTFVPHPQKILQPDKERFLINTYEQRRKFLSALGVDILIELKFDRDFSTMGPEDFLKKYLFVYPKLRNMYLGYDFAFGANKQGGFDLVSEICKLKGMNVEIQPKFEVGSQVVSSSFVRQLIATGSLKEADDLLGRPFELEGLVVKGEGRGKKIGFPTANIQVSSDIMIPQRGVYVTKTLYKGMMYKSVTNIGYNPTFKDGNQTHIETNIFDFDNDIYGETLEIQFLQKIREEKKFSTVNDLIEQIKADVKVAREHLL